METTVLTINVAGRESDFELFDVKVETKERTREKVKSQDIKLRVNDGNCSREIKMNKSTESQSVKHSAAGNRGAEGNVNDKPARFNPIEMRIHFSDPSTLVGPNDPNEGNSSLQLVNGAETNGLEQAEGHVKMDVGGDTNLLLQTEIPAITENESTLQTIQINNNADLKNDPRNAQQTEPEVNRNRKVEECELKVDSTKSVSTDEKDINKEFKASAQKNTTTCTQNNEKDESLKGAQSEKLNENKELTRSVTPPVPAVSIETSNDSKTSVGVEANTPSSSQAIEHVQPISSSKSEKEDMEGDTTNSQKTDSVGTEKTEDNKLLNGMTKEEILSQVEATLSELDLPKGPEVYLKIGRRLEDGFKVDAEVGRGRFGVVRKVIEKSSGREFAAKYIAVNSQTRKETIEEIKMMNYIHNKRLVYLHDAYETKANVILLLEYIPGGELFEKICEDDNLTEREACRYMQQLLEGVFYLHRKSIVHLDLKPENILCVPRPERKDDIKLIDFGMARFVEPGLKIACGTPEFVAPEVLGYEEVSLASDMWSIGVITFVLLSGLSPFLGDSDVETIGNVSRGEWDTDFEDEDFENISELAKDFIRELLVMDPKERNDVKKCLTHDWILDQQKSDEAMRLAYHQVQVSDKESTLNEPSAEEKRASQLPERKLSIKHLKKFIARRRWQRTLKAVRAMTRLRMFSFMRSASQDKNGDVTAQKDPEVSTDQ